MTEPLRFRTKPDGVLHLQEKYLGAVTAGINTETGKARLYKVSYCGRKVPEDETLTQEGWNPFRCQACERIRVSRRGKR